MTAYLIITIQETKIEGKENGDLDLGNNKKKDSMRNFRTSLGFFFLIKILKSFIFGKAFSLFNFHIFLIKKNQRSKL